MRTIRIATPEDAAQISAIYAPYILLSATSFELIPPKPQEFADRIQLTLETHPFLVCVQDSEVLGYAYATAHRVREAYRWSTEVSAYIKESHHGLGIGKALYVALFDILRRQGYVNAYAGITLPNAESIGFHQAMGFESVGVYKKIGFKHGVWHDVSWWHKILRAASLDPDEPIPFSKLELQI